MTREIKFRAWHAPTGKIYLVSQMSFAFENGVMAKLDGYPYEGDKVTTSLRFDKLMQYTGLKDKNGKEIYDGDVIRIEETVISQNDVQRQIRGADIVQSIFIGSVAWCNETASYDLLDKDGECIIGFPRHEQTYEVLGNIYETPELLK